MPKTAVIIGAGPAGLTAAYELLARTGIRPVILEMSGEFGGISKTVCHHGNRMDLGGHRFFSKSKRVNEWWLKLLPLQGAPARDEAAGQFQGLPLAPGGPDPELTDEVMLMRHRLSRILFLGKLFDYPVSLNFRTVANLGLMRSMKIGGSYLRASLHPIRPEQSLEDFFINRFGRELYTTFFRDYTEKVWGIPCREIKPEWGAQRIKGLSVGKAIMHALATRLGNGRQKRKVETSLIDQFMYPKLGPGQLWEKAAARVMAQGGEIHRHHRVAGLVRQGQRITAVQAVNEKTGEQVTLPADYVFSSMPVRDLVAGLGDSVPAAVRTLAGGLRYRDFITVGLLVRRMHVRNGGGTRPEIIPDNWIYVQESGVKLGRIQIFNNWSPYLVEDANTVWLGLEYFCNEGDAFWSLPDGDLIGYAAEELSRLGFIERADVLDAVALRVPKTYPSYTGTYDRFSAIREFTDSFENLFLVGRNGMHRYNNQDHSMLTAMTAVDNVSQGIPGKENIWAVNSEGDYHEGK